MFKKILVALVLSLVVAGSTSGIAWLLDPAVKKIFIEQNKVFAWSIPLLIVIAFCSKGLSLYFAKATMIGVGEGIKKKLQVDMVSTLVGTDTQIIDKKHSGKFITNLTNDVGMITNLVSTAILNLFKIISLILGYFSKTL